MNPYFGVAGKKEEESTSNQLMASWMGHNKKNKARTMATKKEECLNGFEGQSVVIINIQGFYADSRSSSHLTWHFIIYLSRVVGKWVKWIYVFYERTKEFLFTFRQNGINIEPKFDYGTTLAPCKLLKLAFASAEKQASASVCCCFLFSIPTQESLSVLCCCAETQVHSLHTNFWWMEKKSLAE